MFEGWDLDQLRTQGMKIESAELGKDAMSKLTINKLGKYSYKNINKNNKKPPKKKKKCFRCGEDFSLEHLKVCTARNAKCSNCSIIGHLGKVYKKVNEI